MDKLLETQKTGFVLGDIVFLKSGSSPLTIKGFQGVDVTDPADSHIKAICHWICNNEEASDTFDIHTLSRTNDPEWIKRHG